MKTLYFGGAVLPMDRPGKAQALVVEDGKILAVGALEEVEPLAQGARRVELNTFGFQAPGFYEKLGYRLVGSVEPSVGDYGHYYYAKELT